MGAERMCRRIGLFDQFDAQSFSDGLTDTEKIIDELCVIKSMSMEQFNHAPAQLLMYTGNANWGNSWIGSWVTMA